MKGCATFTCLMIPMQAALFSQPAARPEFEAATVKANVSANSYSRWDPDHGNFRAENAPLKRLLSSAYKIPVTQISGPDWLGSLRYDVNAKGTADAPDAQVWLMLQALLEERFRLRVHRETKEMPVYFLTLASGGLKVRPLADPSKPPDLGPWPMGRWSVLEMTGTMAEFAGLFSPFVERPVLDKTGVEGKFRLRLYYNNRADSEGPDMFAALREQIGVRLEQGRGPVEILVVDQAEKVPIEN